jgi:hypothetical protein
MTPNSVERYGCNASNRQNSKSFAQIRGARVRQRSESKFRDDMLLAVLSPDSWVALDGSIGLPSPEKLRELERGQAY